MVTNNSIVPLEKKFKKKKFNCKIESLNDYLHKRASQDIKRKIASCFVLVNEAHEVLGYYTLYNSSIPKASIPETIRNRIPYQDYPVTLLGRLAIDANHQGKGYGTLLLVDALHRSYSIAHQIASAAVIVDPINSEAEAFYAKYGFIKLPDSQRMFLHMSTIKQLFDN
jgi:GNAT superfamily N-acetyltransferase